MKPLIGAVEAGGTKMVCAVGTGPDDIRDEVRFPTSSPEECLPQVIDYFTTWQAEHGEQIAAIGYGTFGPCDPHPDSPTFGWVTKTPKPGWTDTDVVGPLRAAFGIPIGFDTDVNGAALGEHLWGAAQDVDTFVYLTIGTGIGGGHHRQRPDPARPDPPRGRPRGHAPGPGDRSLPGPLPVPRRLPRGPGRRTGDRRAVEAARLRARPRPPGLGPRGPVPGRGLPQPGLHAVPPAHRPRRWGHGAAAPVPPDPDPDGRDAQRLRPGTRDPRADRRLHRPARAWATGRECPAASHWASRRWRPRHDRRRRPTRRRPMARRGGRDGGRPRHDRRLRPGRRAARVGPPRHRGAACLRRVGPMAADLPHPAARGAAQRPERAGRPPGHLPPVLPVASLRRPRTP